MAEIEKTAGIPIDDEELDQVAGGISDEKCPVYEDWGKLLPWENLETIECPEPTPEQQSAIDRMNDLLNHRRDTPSQININGLKSKF